MTVSIIGHTAFWYAEEARPLRTFSPSRRVPPGSDQQLSEGSYEP
jgi:hypothetical protein